MCPRHPAPRPTPPRSCHPGFDLLQEDRRRFIRVDYPGGCCSCNVKNVQFKHMDPGKPMWPIDDESLPPRS